MTCSGHKNRYIHRQHPSRTENELMEAVLIKRPKPSLNIKRGHSQGAKLLLFTRPLPRDGLMAEDHGAPEAGQLPRV